MAKNRKLLLIILDGWGYRKEKKGNAILAAKTPHFDRLWQKYPHALLQASGEAVGLPAGQMGTSEVNHMTIGAGRVIFQDLVKINRAIKDGSLETNQAVLAALEHVKKNRSTLHLQGLVSPGGVHSHQKHFYALLSLAKRAGISRVLVHVFTDGRDTLPKSALRYIRELEDFMQKLNLGKIASVCGRYYAMDRDENWERTDLALGAMIKGEGRSYHSAVEAIEAAYNLEESDEFISPSVIEMEPGESGCVESEDAVIFVNFRSDRAVQLSRRMLEKKPPRLHFATMSQYREEFDCQVLFPPEKVENTLGEIIAAAGLKQLRITETEKFNHLTYFFNCKRLESLEGEDRIMLDSYSDIKTHDERPEMRTLDIAREITQAIQAGTHSVIITNFCNPDMVGHSAKMGPAIIGVETADSALGQVVKAGLAKNFAIIVTADHGNAEELIDQKTGQPMTSHTTNPVPFIFASRQPLKLLRNQASLIDIAPTALKTLGLPQPVEMTGRSLI
ncbi:MAG: 2,3-bisphosphoglycerate-independent phosphoglycerate mutase [Candidatus Pacebacteria bacterium]|nr:2,3-bisphosphoglycerate-independent phosphoglycerate mutase [Candidatus Paceibacterota bacterium]